MDNFSGKKIAVVGYGIEGKSLVSFLIKQNPSQINIFDEQTVGLNPDHQKQFIHLERKKIEQINFDNIDAVFKSPGIKRNRLNCKDGKISTLTNLFFSLAKGKIIAVTGTKGKSTTVLLVKELLEQYENRVFIGGNIGQPMLDFLDELDETSYSVLELSSFQIQDLKHSPDIAIILPIFADHLDYHKDFDEYLLAKKRIFENSREVVIMTDRANQQLLDLEAAPNEVVYFSADELPDQAKQLAKVCQLPAVDVSAMATLASYLELKPDYQKIAEKFKKLPLRIENIGQIRETIFYNDSASTNPISTSKAIELMSGETLVIIGGSSKGLKMDLLANKIKDDLKIKKVVLFGDQAKAFAEELKKSGYGRDLSIKNSLTGVFRDLNFGDYKNILFSPAYASFDQYKNYKERGEDFNKEFNKLKCQNT